MTSREDTVLIHEGIQGHHVCIQRYYNIMVGEILQVQREHDHRAVCLIKSVTVLNRIQCMIQFNTRN